MPNRAPHEQLPHEQTPLRADARRNLERICAAASEAFQTHGLDAPLEDIARQVQRTPQQVLALIAAARARLLPLRARRVRPARDDKVLTSWNALMIRGMAVAARALAREDLASSATRALDFIRATLWREGRLLASYMDGRAHLNAYLDDYVYLADAILELQLHRLTQLSVDEIVKELKAIRERIAELEEILASDKKLKSVIIAELIPAEDPGHGQ